MTGTQRVSAQAWSADRGRGCTSDESLQKDGLPKILVRVEWPAYGHSKYIRSQT
jgi:hypothetical protein